MMTIDEIRDGFDRLIAAVPVGPDRADQIARLEVAREYFTDSAFRTWLSEFVWQTNQKSELEALGWLLMNPPPGKR
jgi:hypothetical protein